MKILLLLVLVPACGWTNTNIPDENGRTKGSLMSRSTLNGKPINRSDVAEVANEN